MPLVIENALTIADTSRSLIDTFQVHLTNQETRSFWDILQDYFPIITLLLGALIGYGMQRITEFSRIKEIRKYLQHSIEDLIAASEKQTGHLKLYAQKLREKEQKLPVLDSEAGFHLRSLETISRYDTFKAIVLKGFVNKEKKRDLLNDYNNALEIIKVVEEHSKDEISFLSTTESREKDNYNRYFFDLQKAVNDKISALGDIPDEADDGNFFGEDHIYIRKLIKIWNDFIMLNPVNRTIFHHEELLVYPLLELAQSRHDSELVNLLPAMVNILGTIKSTREGVSKRFDLFVDDLEKANQNLVNLCNSLKK